MNEKTNTHPIAQLRKRMGWTQQVLADKSGVTKKTIENAERGDNVSEATLTRIAHSLGVTQQELLGSKLRDAPPPRTRSETNPWKYKLVAFDADGTLIRGSSTASDFHYSWDSVWGHLKLPKSIQKEGKRQFYDQETDLQGWCDYASKYFKRENLRRSDFAEITANVRLTNNFYSTLTTLKDEGFFLVLISGGIDCFVEQLIPDYKAWFDRVFITEFHFDGDKFNFAKTHGYDFEGKADALRLACEEFGITLEQSVFIGDSVNDIHAAEAAGLSIAYPFRPSSNLDLKTDVQIEGDDLSLILDHVLTRS